VAHSRGRLWVSRALWGWILVGWGVFSLVEGVVDHHILGIHHVRSGEHQTWWDISCWAPWVSSSLTATLDGYGTLLVADADGHGLVAVTPPGGDPDDDDNDVNVRITSTPTPGGN
jgi:hypothetical protein